MTERLPLTDCGRVHIGPVVMVLNHGYCHSCHRWVTMAQHEEYLKTHYEVIQIMTRAILEAREWLKPAGAPLRRLP